MSAAIAESVPQFNREQSTPSRLGGRTRTFAEWCLLREATSYRTYFLLVNPLLFSAFMVLMWRYSWLSGVVGAGPYLFRQIVIFAALFTFLNACQHASKAICWEMSSELRDLVRLTGVNPVALLWCRTLSRWWTIFLSVILFIPFLAYARTLRGVTNDDWIIAISWLALIACLSAGFAMMAGVSVTKGSTAEATAGSATLILMLLYHFLFWVPSAMFVIFGWVMNSFNDPPASSIYRQVAKFIFSFSPAILFYQNLYDLLSFAPFAPQFWLHFLTAFVCMWLSVRVARNRFRVTSQGDCDDAPIVTKTNTTATRLIALPRCTDQPLLWKDYYILGVGANGGGGFWFGFSCLALYAVISALFYQMTHVAAILATIIAPCLFAVRFDALLAVEMREKTFDSLMILPIDPWMIMLSKVQVALWERRWLAMPLLVASGLAAIHWPIATAMGISIGFLAMVLMIEISIVNHVSHKHWWMGPTIAVLIVGMLIINIFALSLFGTLSAYMVSVLWLTFSIAVFHGHNDRRLRHWAGV